MASTTQTASGLHDPWARYVPSDAAPWNLARVVHLHRRAGFAATWSRDRARSARGTEPSVTRLLKGNAHLDGTLKDFESVSAASPSRPPRPRPPIGSRRGGSSACSSRPIRWASD